MSRLQYFSQKALNRFIADPETTLRSHLIYQWLHTMYYQFMQPWRTCGRVNIMFCKDNACR
ncbi:hypothetical protein [Crinalium epipsammum]|uniref:hypothetical protein n=1 Tax=Crinalium epipsammum TaxID=241425 RepID=UPI0003075E43|nr:hypothetical protein [Crinalium epipsammum]